MPPGVDHIGALPDEILHHILSLLSVLEAVRTCVLAHRWRNLWKCTTRLRLIGTKGLGPVRDLRKFVDHLLILRERVDLDTVLIAFNEFHQEDVPFINLWIRYAVERRVRVLDVLQTNYCRPFRIDGMPFTSRHLTKLGLYNVRRIAKSLDFSTCPALESLKLCSCEINVGNMALGSVKHLKICFSRSVLRLPVQVSAPCLVSLNVDGFTGLTPLFERMPLLETASLNLGVSFDETTKNFCQHYRKSRVFCGTNHVKCSNCRHLNSGSSNGSVLLGAIYNAKHVKLISSLETIISPRDSELCPTFNNLRNLLLNHYWCVGPDFSALSCILKHSPVLEKLTLQLVSEGEIPNLEMKGSYSPTERSTVVSISQHLKKVDVKCCEVAGKVANVLKFLSTLNIRF